MDWSTDWDYVLSGSQEEEYAGIAKGVGDINGDSHNDIVVGAPAFDVDYPEKENSGNAYIIFGPISGPPNERALSNSTQILGSSHSQGLGFNVTPVGDVNGDNLNDFILSNMTDASPGNGSKSFLVLGRSQGDWDISAEFYDENEYENAVYATGIGDFNGDGKDDFAIGAPNGAWDWKGEVFIFFGRSSWNEEYDVVYDANLSFIGDVYDLIGDRMAGVGDIDGDGYDDMIIAGKYSVYLICGKPNVKSQGSNNCMDVSILEAADASFYRHYVYNGGYYSVSGIGDVNDDGYPDFAIGDTYAEDGKGETYAFYGGPE